MASAQGQGEREDPWVLRTPPGTSEYTMYRDESADPPALVCQVGTTTLSYRLPPGGSAFDAEGARRLDVPGQRR